jgi:hypothetical protein
MKQARRRRINLCKSIESSGRKAKKNEGLPQPLQGRGEKALGDKLDKNAQQIL